MRGKAWRREQRRKRVSRAIRAISTWSVDKDFIEEHARKTADHMKSCSCWMCGNARAHYGETMKEKIARMETEEWISNLSETDSPGSTAEDSPPQP